MYVVVYDTCPLGGVLIGGDFGWGRAVGVRCPDRCPLQVGAGHLVGYANPKELLFSEIENSVSYLSFSMLTGIQNAVHSGLRA